MKDLDVGAYREISAAVDILLETLRHQGYGVRECAMIIFANAAETSAGIISTCRDSALLSNTLSAVAATIRGQQGVEASPGISSPAAVAALEQAMADNSVAGPLTEAEHLRTLERLCRDVESGNAMAEIALREHIADAMRLIPRVSLIQFVQWLTKARRRQQQDATNKN